MFLTIEKRKAQGIVIKYLIFLLTFSLFAKDHILIISSLKHKQRGDKNFEKILREQFIDKIDKNKFQITARVNQNYKEIERLLKRGTYDAIFLFLSPDQTFKTLDYSRTDEFTDQNFNSLLGIFQHIHPRLKYFKILGPKTGFLLDQNWSNGFYDHQDTIISGQKQPLNIFKQIELALSHFKKNYKKNTEIGSCTPQKVIELQMVYRPSTSYKNGNLQKIGLKLFHGEYYLGEIPPLDKQKKYLFNLPIKFYNKNNKFKLKPISNKFNDLYLGSYQITFGSNIFSPIKDKYGAIKFKSHIIFKSKLPSVTTAPVTLKPLYRCLKLDKHEKLLHLKRKY